MDKVIKIGILKLRCNCNGELWDWFIGGCSNKEDLATLGGITPALMRCRRCGNIYEMDINQFNETPKTIGAGSLKDVAEISINEWVVRGRTSRQSAES